MAISFVAKSAFASGTAGLTVGAVTGTAANDLILLFVESANQAITTPTGYTIVTGAQASAGTAAAAGGMRLNVFYRWATGADATVAVTDTGDHTTAIKVVYRGVSTSTPFDATPVVGTKTTASTSSSYPGITTVTNSAWVVYASALDLDAASTATTSAQANAALTGITERHDQTVASGFGGGIVVTDGVKATAGASGNLTATVTSTQQVYVTLALRPAPANQTLTPTLFTSTTNAFYAANVSGNTWISNAASDPYASQVASSSHLDGTNGATSFTDDQGNVFTRTSGSGTVSTTLPKFGTAALYGGTSTTPFEAPHTAAMAYGSQNFTIEFFYAPVSPVSGDYYVPVQKGTGLNASKGFSIGISTLSSGTTLAFNYWDGTGTGQQFLKANSGTLWPANTYRHIALVRNGGTLRFFLDGVTTSADDISGLNQNFQVGVDPMMLGSPGGSAFAGYLDEFRFTVGVARYTTSFTPPTAPYGGGMNVGTSTATASLTALIRMAAAVSATNTVSADLTTLSPPAALEAAVSSTATTATALTTAILFNASVVAVATASAPELAAGAAPLVATVSAACATSAVLTTSIQMQAVVASLAAAPPPILTTAIRFVAPVAAVSVATGVFTTSIKLVATPAAVATGSASFTTAIQLAGTTAATASTTAALTTAVSLAAAVSVTTSTVTATLTNSAAAFAAASVSQATGTAALTTAIQLSGAVNALSTSVNATLTGVAAALTGSVGGTTGFTATLNTGIPLTAAVAAQAGTTAALTAQIKLAGSVAALAAATGAFTTAIRLAGSAQAVASTPTATLAGQAAVLAAAVSAVPSATGVITTAIQLAGSAQAIATVAAELPTTSARFVTNSAAEATASGALTTAIKLAGVASAQTTTTAETTTSIRLAGSVAAQATVVTATLTGSAVEFAATISATPSVTAGLSTSIRLNSAAAATATASANLDTSGVTSGTAVAVATASADLTTALRFTANVGAQASGFADLNTAIRLSGSTVSVATARIYTGFSASEGPRRVRQPVHQATTAIAAQPTSVEIQADRKGVIINSEVV